MTDGDEQCLHRPQLSQLYRSLQHRLCWHRGSWRGWNGGSPLYSCTPERFLRSKLAFASWLSWGSILHSGFREAEAGFAWGLILPVERKLQADRDPYYHWNPKGSSNITTFAPVLWWPNYTNICHITVASAFVFIAILIQGGKIDHTHPGWASSESPRRWPSQFPLSFSADDGIALWLRDPPVDFSLVSLTLVRLLLLLSTNASPTLWRIIFIVWYDSCSWTKSLEKKTAKFFMKWRATARRLRQWLGLDTYHSTLEFEPIFAVLNSASATQREHSGKWQANHLLYGLIAKRDPAAAKLAPSLR